MNERSKLINNVVGPRPGHQSSKTLVQQKDDVAEINILYADIIAQLSNAIQSGIMIGEILTRKKSELEHGKFTPWLKQNVKFSERHARRFMQMYSERDLLNRTRVSSLREALKLLAEQPEEKDVTPTLSAPELYKRFSTGENLGKREREILKTWLNDQYKATETKLKKIKTDLGKI